MSEVPKPIPATAVERSATDRDTLTPFPAIQTPTDYGMSRRDLLRVRNFLNAAQADLQLDPEMGLYLEGIIQTQEGYAARRDTTRRKIITAGLGVLAFGGIAALCSSINAANNSPEAQARRQAEKKAAAEQKLREQLEFEKRVLTTKPSAISAAGWTVRNLEPDFPLPELEQVGTERVDRKNFLTLNYPSLLFTSERTSIQLTDYERSDKVYVPVITVTLKHGDGSEHIYERWLLGNPVNEEKDLWNTLAFENRTGDVRYATPKRITAKTSDGNVSWYELSIRKPKK